MGTTCTPVAGSNDSVTIEEHFPHSQKWATWRENLRACIRDLTSNWKIRPSRKYRSGTAQAGFAHWVTIS